MGGEEDKQLSQHERRLDGLEGDEPCGPSESMATGGAVQDSCFSENERVSFLLSKTEKKKKKEKKGKERSWFLYWGFKAAKYHKTQKPMGFNPTPSHMLVEILEFSTKSHDFI